MRGLVMPRISDIRFLSDPSPRTRAICWVLALIGVFAVITGGIALVVDAWGEAARTDAEAWPCPGYAECPLTLAEGRHSSFGFGMFGTAVTCFGIGLFHAWARNAECGWLSRLVRWIVGTYVNWAVAVGLFYCAALCIAGVYITITDWAFTNAATGLFLTLYRVALCLISGAVAALGYLYWYPPKWEKAAGGGRSVQE